MIALYGLLGFIFPERLIQAVEMECSIANGTKKCFSESFRSFTSAILKKIVWLHISNSIDVILRDVLFSTSSFFTHQERRVLDDNLVPLLAFSILLFLNLFALICWTDKIRSGIYDLACIFFGLYLLFSCTLQALRLLRQRISRLRITH